MAAHPPPVLPPFDEDTESIEQAAQQLLDHGAQLKFLRQQNAQIARRQDVLNQRFASLNVDVGRIADGQTVCTGLMDLMNRRLAKLMRHHKVEDVEDVPEADAL